MSKKLTALEELLARKEENLKNKGKQRTSTFFHERTGITYTFRELTGLETEEYNSVFKKAEKNMTKSEEEEIEESTYKMLAKTIIDPDLTDNRLKEAYKYVEPSEFLKEHFSNLEMVELIRRIMGLAQTIK